jgi:hypothetical protein
MTFVKMLGAVGIRGQKDTAIALGCSLSALIHGAAIVVFSAPAQRPLPVLVSQEWEIAVTIEYSESWEVVEGVLSPERSLEGIAPRARKARLPTQAVVAVTPPEAPPSALSGERLTVAQSPPVAIEAPPRSEGAATVPPEVARALRVYESFPNMAVEFMPGGRHQPVTLEVCVSERGMVTRATVGSSTVDAFQERVRAAALTWRYRPLLMSGRAIPFCHLIRVTYEMS